MPVYLSCYEKLAQKKIRLFIASTHQKHYPYLTTDIVPRLSIGIGDLELDISYRLVYSMSSKFRFHQH